MALKQRMKGLTIAPYSDGRFEVYVGGEKVYSKLETGDFPDEETLVKRIAKKVV